MACGDRRWFRGARANAPLRHRPTRPPNPPPRPLLHHRIVMSGRRAQQLNLHGARGMPPHMADEDASFVTRFLHEEILHPEKVQGNIAIATGVAVFFGGIAAIRTWGELMIPA
jgi:hypothetical protein